MISYLPEIYPDELVYSWFCRYYVHSGNLTNSDAMRDILFNRCNNPSKEFIGHINNEALEVIQKMYHIDELIINHTMFPQCARFVSLDRRKNALFHIGYDFKDVHHLFSVLPRIDIEKFLRYGPLCVKEDREEHGETYWHRQHQIRNIQVCAKHKCRLTDSIVTAKSEQTFTFCPAEINIESCDVDRTVENNELKYVQYVTDVFNAPMDFENDVPVSAVLYHAMTQTKYLKSSGKTRYTKKLSEDMHTFFQDIGLKNIASIYQIQRTLLGDRFDFSVICQIAYFLNISVEDLTAPKINNNQIVAEKSTHYMKDKAPIDWVEFDKQNAPILEKIASDIYYGRANKSGRPDRVSERLIYREMNFHKHRLEKLSMCKVIFEQYTEPYEETWARRIIWAYNKLKCQKGGLIYWSDIRNLSGVKRENIDAILPYVRKHADEKTFNDIFLLLGI